MNNLENIVRIKLVNLYCPFFYFIRLDIFILSFYLIIMLKGFMQSTSDLKVLS